MIYRFVKRIFDLMFSFLGLLLVLPILISASLLIFLESKGPVFFCQERLGRYRKTFTLYKLRSMKVNADRLEKQVRQDDPEITTTGRFIRRFKIDELPQLINVLKGDMSLIGPRPCLPSLQEKFDENAVYRFKVRPGLTGWAQVNGNINNSWPIRWQYDRYYVEHLTFVLDIRIFFKTIIVLIFGE